MRRWLIRFSRALNKRMLGATYQLKLSLATLQVHWGDFAMVRWSTSRWILVGGYSAMDFAEKCQLVAVNKVTSVSERRNILRTAVKKIKWRNCLYTGCFHNSAPTFTSDQNRQLIHTKFRFSPEDCFWIWKPSEHDFPSIEQFWIVLRGFFLQLSVPHFSVVHCGAPSVYSQRLNSR